MVGVELPTLVSLKMLLFIYLNCDDAIRQFVERGEEVNIERSSALRIAKQAKWPLAPYKLTTMQHNTAGRARTKMSILQPV